MFENLMAEAEKKAKAKAKQDKKGKKNKHQKTVVWDRGKDLLGLMGIDYVNRWTKAEDVRTFSYYRNAAADIERNMLPVSGYDYITKGYMYSYSDKKSTTYRKYTITHKGKEKHIQFSNDGKNMLIQVGDDKAVFNYAAFILGLRKEGIVAMTTVNREHFSVNLVSKNKQFRVKINVVSVNGKITPDNKVKVISLYYLFLIKFN